MRQAVRRAKPSQCPRPARPLHAYSTETQRAYAISCGSWTCDFCGWRKQQVAAYLVLAGMTRAHNKGQRIRFMTLTEDPKKPLTLPGLYKAWSRLRQDLKRAKLLNEYVSVLEMTAKGRPHLHVVLTGSYIPQWKLSKLAAEAGFGRVADIRAVQMDPDGDHGIRAADYVAKELSGYLSKSKKDQGMAKLVAKRRRPMRSSHGWYPRTGKGPENAGGMRRAERELLEACAFKDDDRDEGPFWFVIGDPASTLVITGRGTDGETFKVRDRASLPSGGDSDQGKGGEVVRLRDTTETSAALVDGDERREAA